MVPKKLSKSFKSWEVIEEKKLRRVFTFKDFSQAMQFVSAVAQSAEAANHHPDISIHYNQVTLELWTHRVSGLTEEDFSLARTIDGLV